MADLDFYEIDTNYLQYLKQIDSSVPHYSYNTHDKFFCGIVTKMNGFQYFAPISSFKQQQATNLVIKNSDGVNIASIRFCFMVPADDSVLKIKDFKLENDAKYVGLLSTELTFCRQHELRIQEKAKRVYQFGVDSTHTQYKNCCDFLALEQAANQYVKVDLAIQK